MVVRKTGQEDRLDLRDWDAGDVDSAPAYVSIRCIILVFTGMD